ncbi:MAG: hypothetical protein N2258_02235 [Brevinematales bacterium]|nr:hypothetical protein [Brevinematales bacterium]
MWRILFLIFFVFYSCDVFDESKIKFQRDNLLDPNNSSYNRIVEKPVIKVKGGTYTNSVLVSINSSTIGATIFWSTNDGVTWVAGDNVNIVYNCRLKAKASIGNISSEEVVEDYNIVYLFAKSYGHTLQEHPVFMQKISEEGYIILAQTLSFGVGNCDIWLIKVDDLGNIKFEKSYGRDVDEYPISIIKTFDGQYIIVGYTIDNNANVDIFVLKVDNNGYIKWQKIYDGYDIDIAVGVEETLDGKYLVTGIANRDIFLMKLDSDGNIEWQKSYGGNKIEQGEKILLLSDGYLIGGSVGSVSPGSNDILLMKVDLNGNIEWQKTYGGVKDDYLKCIQETSDGKYILVGTTRSFGVGNTDIWLLKVDNSGNIEFQNTYGGDSFDEVYSIQKTTDGGYILCGSTQSFGKGLGDIWLLKINSNWNIEWQKTYGGISNDTGTMCYQTKDGGYIILGSTVSFGSGDRDLWILKILADGNFPGLSSNTDGILQQTYISPQNCFLTQNYNFLLTNAFKGFFLMRNTEAIVKQQAP